MQEEPPSNPNSLASIGRKIVTYEIMTAPVWIVGMLIFNVPIEYFVLVAAACLGSALLGFVLMRQGSRR